MQLHKIHTKVVQPGDDLTHLVLEAVSKQSLKVENGDILAIASKAVATAENRFIRLTATKPSKKAEKIAERYGLDPRFVEIILQEADEIYWGVPGALLTLKRNILAPNAGVDQKNAPQGNAVLWPENPDGTAERIRKGIYRETSKRVGVLIVDSRVTPLRVGTTGIAIGLAGFHPVRDYRTKKDIYNRRILMTRHALADDLASAAHALMGESSQKTPAVLIKKAPIELVERADTSTMIIPREQCLFASHMKPQRI